MTKKELLDRMEGYSDNAVVLLHFGKGQMLQLKTDEILFVEPFEETIVKLSIVE